MEKPGQADPIRTGALNPDTDHRPEPDQPVRQRPIAGSIGRKRSIPNMPPFYRSPLRHAHRHGCPHRQPHQIPSTWPPLSLAEGQRGGTRHRDGGKDPTEPLLSAQPDPHRPTGACNTTHIIPPSRIWARQRGQERTPIVGYGALWERAILLAVCLVLVFALPLRSPVSSDDLPAGLWGSRTSRS